MVTIVDYAKRESKDGKSFIALILEGEVEAVKSLTNGRYYMTARKTSIVSTLSESAAKRSIGTRIPGEIIRTPVEEPYPFTTTSGQVITLDFSWQFKDVTENVEEKLFPMGKGS